MKILGVNHYDTHDEAKRCDGRIESPHTLYLSPCGGATITFYEPDETPIIGEDLQYILDQFEDEEISKDELIRQAQSVGYTADEIEQILSA